ncbi:MAG: spore maturation protein [Oscillospiraceae bacterium]|nr:spore maturation protein [Oscillospiraceae bacterium]
MKFSDFVIPVFIAVVVIYGVYKKIDVFEVFCEGAKKGLETSVAILPALLGLVVCVGMLSESGFLDWVTGVISPITTALGFPEECVSLAVLKPVSGSGSTAMLNEILTKNHPDSFPGRVASVIAGATETTFYTIAVYFGSANLRGSKRIILCSLLADVVGFIFATVTVNMFL